MKGKPVTSYEPMVFDDLEPTCIPVKLKGVEYVLKEADEAALIRFRNFMSRNVTYGDNGVTKIENQGEAPALLVSLCLFKVSQDRDDKTVHVPTLIQDIKKWRTHVVTELYKKARSISGMDDELDTVEKIDKQIEELEEKKAKLLKTPKEEQVKN